MMFWMIIGLAVLITVVLFIIIARGAASHRPAARVEPAEIDVVAVNDPLVQDALAAGHKIEAIKHYREISGVGLKDAKEVIEYLMAGGTIEQKKRQKPSVDAAAGIRDLLDEGRRDEAVDLYARFAGVDPYTAQDAVDEIEREMRLADAPDGPGKLSLIERGELQQLLQEGKQIEAVKRYRELTGLGLKEAKDAVDDMARGLG